MHLMEIPLLRAAGLAPLARRGGVRQDGPRSGGIAEAAKADKRLGADAQIASVKVYTRALSDAELLASYEDVLKQHSVVVFFLTMLVGAGGNAGNQAAVRVIRGLAVGAVVPLGW